jgi:hypothetical protein
MEISIVRQVKRIHEYKRQLLNVLGIIWKYDQIKKMTPDQRAQVIPFPASVCIIGCRSCWLTQLRVPMGFVVLFVTW